MDKKEWMEIRSEGYKYARMGREWPIVKYMRERGINDELLYEYVFDKETSHNCLVIRTSRPGVWIGLHGQGVERFKEILKECTHKDIEVKFIELKSGMGIIRSGASQLITCVKDVFDIYGCQSESEFLSIIKVRTNSNIGGWGFRSNYEEMVFNVPNSLGGFDEEIIFFPMENEEVISRISDIAEKSKR